MANYWDDDRRNEYGRGRQGRTYGDDRRSLIDNERDFDILEDRRNWSDGRPLDDRRVEGRRMTDRENNRYSEGRYAEDRRRRAETDDFNSGRTVDYTRSLPTDQDYRGYGRGHQSDVNYYYGYSGRDTQSLDLERRRNDEFNASRAFSPSRETMGFGDQAPDSYSRNRFGDVVNADRDYNRMYAGGRDNAWDSADYIPSTTEGPHTGRGPKGWQRSDESIKDRVCEILERDAHIDASEMEVEVKAGVVTLRGSVDDRSTKRRAEDSIDRLPGVRDVRNELTVDRSLFQRARDFVMGRSTETNPGLADPAEVKRGPNPTPRRH